MSSIETSINIETFCRAGVNLFVSFRPVHDIHDFVNITILDEDRHGAPEFLGRVGIPLLSVST